MPRRICRRRQALSSIARTVQAGIWSISDKYSAAELLAPDSVVEIAINAIDEQPTHSLHSETSCSI